MDPWQALDRVVTIQHVTIVSSHETHFIGSSPLRHSIPDENVRIRQNIMLDFETRCAQPCQAWWITHVDFILMTAIGDGYLADEDTPP